MYHAVIEIRAAGLPACAGLTRYAYQPPFRGSPHLCASDVDYYGFEEIEWEVLDRRGRPAPWLGRKLSAADRAAIERQLSAHAAALRAGGDL